MKKSILLTLAALLLLSGMALAATYIYRAMFTCQVTVETGTPGLTVAPQTIDFGTMAIGDWSKNQTLTVKNIGTETIVSLYFETNAPAGLTFYTATPPVMPLTPGSQISFPVSLKADGTVAAGSYNIMVTVTGQR